jgi:DNA-directed RNA polymerase subunit RPC12/RpoP
MTVKAKTKPVEERTDFVCPNCGYARMTKAGGGWSGAHKKQLYRCKRCGRRWLNVKEDFVEKPKGKPAVTPAT